MSLEWSLSMIAPRPMPGVLRVNPECTGRASIGPDVA